jgi:hypothetical protein
LKERSCGKLICVRVVFVLKGRGFSRAARRAKTSWALAPEGMFIQQFTFPLKASPFNATTF